MCNDQEVSTVRRNVTFAVVPKSDSDSEYSGNQTQRLQRRVLTGLVRFHPDGLNVVESHRIGTITM